MFLTEFFNTPEGDSYADIKATSATTQAKRPHKTIRTNMVAESNEMADVITARDYANKAIRDPNARQTYFDYLARLRSKHGKEYSTSVHQKATKLTNRIKEDQWSGPNNAWNNGDDQWSDGRGQWSESQEGVDSITVDVPLMIRLLEYAREDAKTDVDLHNVAEHLISLSQEGRTLNMDDYEQICNTKDQ